MNKIMPTLDNEISLWSKGFNYIGGIDEAGRGSWAGPVVAAVVVLPKNHQIINSVTDSKLLSPLKREELFTIITTAALDYGVGIVDNNEIDMIGILNATKLASKRAVDSLTKSPDYLLTDALDLKKLLNIKQEAHIKGDQKIYTISCASIVAKVTRDRIMSNLGPDYSQYLFEKHKGYGTKLHSDMLGLHGVSDIHRKSYMPVKAHL